ncbi:MAG TPA: hypothetical protein VF039_10675 [Longimicrobiales bacterium]
MRIAAAAIALLLTATPACAQEHDHGENDHAERAGAGRENPASQPKPAGWLVRLDRPDRGSADQVMFTEMAPGWHITTGPAVLLHHPDSVASGEYRLESEVFLFDPGERREGYGLFIGGRDLEGEAQRYIYFLLRRDGTYLVKTREGDETAIVRDWTRHDAINDWDDRAEGEQAVRNQLTIEVGADDVVFFVNDAEVARVPRSELPDTDGVFGLRVNHSVNLHVTSLQRTR